MALAECEVLSILDMTQSRTRHSPALEVLTFLVYIHTACIIWKAWAYQRVSFAFGFAVCFSSVLEGKKGRKRDGREVGRENEKQWRRFPERRAMAGGRFMGSSSSDPAQLVREFFLLESDLLTAV